MVAEPTFPFQSRPRMLNPVSAAEQNPTPNAWVNPIPALIHKPVLGLFLLTVAAEIVRLWLRLEWPERWAWVSPGVWVLAAGTLAVGLSRRLPVQNVVSIGCIGGGIAVAIELLNGTTQIPFGQRTLSERFGPVTHGLGWYQPFLWLAMAMACRGVARLAVRPWRKLQYYGIWVMAVATLLALALALSHEAAGGGAGWWRRENRPGTWTWYECPWASMLGWVLTTLVLYAFTTPWFLNKQGIRQPTDWHPLVVWTGLMAWLLALNLAQQHWAAVVIGIGAAGLGVGAAVRGGRW